MKLLLIGMVTLAYPALVYLALGHVEPRWLALLLAGLALARAISSRERMWLVAALGALLLAGVSAFANQALPLKLYPLLVNSVLFTVFVSSLFYPPSIIERWARIREPELPAAAVIYTRKVTQLWAGFFLLNGSIALYTALWASDATWALYNGAIAYGLMGLLFVGEWLVRRRLRARQQHA